MHTPSDDLRRALEALTIFRIWEEAFRDGRIAVPAPTRCGLTKSPFRDDGRHGSFSVIADGRGWKDHGGAGDEHGSCWAFALRCWPQLPKGDLAKRLIELSGITPTPTPPPASVAASGGGVGAGAPTGAAVDPALAKAARALERKAAAARAEDAVWAAREEALRPKAPKAVPPMPACVAARWEEGLTHALGEGRKRLTELAGKRGWPIDWTHQLAEMGKLAFPWETDDEPGERFASRQRAFAVEVPKTSADGAELVQVGYHQQWFSPARGPDQPEKKGWTFLPHCPNPERITRRRRWSAYQRAMVEHAATVGITPDSRAGLIPAVPFVLGDLQETKLLVLLEGQWDAITFFGACGFFHDTTPATGIAVFGIRGAQGTDPFLAHWALWLRRVRPRVWIIADNDAAGGAWREQPPAVPGLPRPPSFAERLVAAGGRDPVLSWLKPGGWGKDFNDYYKAMNGKLTPAKMYAWMTERGLFDAGRGWL